MSVQREASAATSFWAGGPTTAGSCGARWPRPWQQQQQVGGGGGSATRRKQEKFILEGPEFETLREGTEEAPAACGRRGAESVYEASHGDRGDAMSVRSVRLTLVLVVSSSSATGLNPRFNNVSMCELHESLQSSTHPHSPLPLPPDHRIARPTGKEVSHQARGAVSPRAPSNCGRRCPLR